MVRIQDRYCWEAEHADKRVFRQYGADGSENPSTLIRPEEVVRFSILPRVPGLPRHDLLMDRTRGERFVRRFGRGFMKERGGGMQNVEYLQCVETNRYRLWVFSSTGQGVITHPEFEVYL